MKEVVTRQWVQAVQDALVYLAQGRNLDLGPGFRRGIGDAKWSLYFDAAEAGLSRSSGRCPFGEITSWVEGEGEEAVKKTGISGGLISVGPKSFCVNPWSIGGLDPAFDGYIWIEVDYWANMDDEGGVLLPGFLQAEAPPNEWGHGVCYPDATPPSVTADGAGTAVLPIGRLLLEDGKVRVFEPTGCGNFTLFHGAGVVVWTRSA